MRVRFMLLALAILGASCGSQLLVKGSAVDDENGWDKGPAIASVFRYLCKFFKCNTPEAWPVPGVIPPEDPVEAPSISKAVYDFGYQLLNEYRVLHPESNVVFSPVSVTALLSMVYFGANGETKLLIEKHLGFQNGVVPKMLAAKDNQKLTNSGLVSVANRAFFAKDITLKEAFTELVGEHNVAKTPFVHDPAGAVDEINGFVSDQTEGLIPEIVTEDQVTHLTQMVLVNVVYFKEKWTHVFSEELTTKKEFKGVNGPTMVDFMTHDMSVDLQYGDFPEIDSQVVRLPYGGPDDHPFAMYIILPNAEDGWIDVEKNLASMKPANFIDEIYFGAVELLLPKWEIESDMRDMTKILKSMGLGFLFEDSADLSAMSDSSISLSDVVHKAKIIVSENGTEAAAATAGYSTRTAEDLSTRIIMNHPFLYFIMDESDNTVFFQGTVTTIE